MKKMEIAQHIAEAMDITKLPTLQRAQTAGGGGARQAHETARPLSPSGSRHALEFETLETGVALRTPCAVVERSWGRRCLWGSSAPPPSVGMNN